VALTLTEQELAVLSDLQRAGPVGVLSDLVEVVRRMPSYYWGDLREDLEVAERRETPGRVHHDLHHDARGIVNMVGSTIERRRQASRRKSA
jgi:hypothetical protein